MVPLFFYTHKFVIKEALHYIKELYNFFHIWIKSTLHSFSHGLINLRECPTRDKRSFIVAGFSPKRFLVSVFPASEKFDSNLKLDAGMHKTHAHPWTTTSHPCPPRTHGHGWAWAWLWAPNVGLWCASIQMLIKDYLEKVLNVLLQVEPTWTNYWLCIMPYFVPGEECDNYAHGMI